MKNFFLFFFLFISYILSAHEYILLAYKYRVQKGDTLEMHLFVADGFNIQLERPMQTAITKKFELITQQGTIDLLAETTDQALPIINRKVDFEGRVNTPGKRLRKNILNNSKIFSLPQRRSY